MFDDKGEVVIGRDGLPDKRRGPTPCEATIGCPKGHWSDKPDLTDGQQAVIDLFHSAKATGGRSLTEREANDDFLMVAFAKLEEISQSIAASQTHEHNAYMMSRLELLIATRK